MLGGGAAEVSGWSLLLPRAHHGSLSIECLPPPPDQKGSVSSWPLHGLCLSFQQERCRPGRSFGIPRDYDYFDGSFLWFSCSIIKKR